MRGQTTNKDLQALEKLQQIDVRVDEESRALEEIPARLDDLRKAELMVQAVERLTDDLKIPRHLAQFGVKEGDIPMLAEGVMKVTRLLANNPRLLTREDAEDIYRAAL